MNVATNHMLLDALDDEALASRYSPRTRTVSSQFAHMHNIRVSNLDRRGSDKKKLKSFPRGAEPTRAQLLRALKQSDVAIGRLLATCEEANNVKSWGGPPSTYLGYFLAHEAHHRGLVLVSLRLSGIKMPKSVTYGMWYWSRKTP